VFWSSHSREEEEAAAAAKRTINVRTWSPSPLLQQPKQTQDDNKRTCKTPKNFACICNPNWWWAGISFLSTTSGSFLTCFKIGELSVSVGK